MFQRGDEILPGWRVRFVFPADSRGHCYRIERADGTHAFLKSCVLEQGEASRADSDQLSREARLLKSIEGDGVPQLLDSGTLDPDARCYLLTELVSGETLAGLLDRQIALPASRAREILRSLLETITRLHGRDDPVFHNRLTPDHVVLDVREDADGRPVVVGFGGARRASDGPTGTPAGADPHYLPGECLDGPIASPAVDLFSLGALWFHMLFGVPPWSRAEPVARESDLRALVERRRRGPPPMPAHTLAGSIPDQDLRLIRIALSFRPSDRLQDAAAFLGALDSGELGPPVAAPEPADEGRVADAKPGSDTAAPSVLFGLDRAGGMAKLKEELVRDVVKPLRDPDKYRRFGVGIPNGVLLYGPPGCGKTFFAECLGEEIGLPFEAIRPSDIASIYVHGAQQRIAKLFESLRKRAPCVLFLDEVDALLPTRGHGTGHHYAAEVNEWLTQLNRIGDHRVFVITATNQPDRLDPAAIRTGRLDKTFYVGLPDGSARKAMFGIHLRGRPVEPSLDLVALARRTEGRTASDIRFLVDEAARAALAEDAPAVSNAHLKSVIAANPPSVSREQLTVYERLRRRFEGKAGRGGSGSGPIGFRPPRQRERSQG